ncbi:MAG: U32 family peptidase [Acidobacteria bacterium]|nr:U32 family peptidase [Acidobacteriota bacterium]
MEMRYHNIPADFKKETIDKYAELNSRYEYAKVKETYGQITIANPIGSGRAYDLIPQVDMSDLETYIAYSREKNIGFNYTLNTTCLGNKEFTEEGMKEILKFLDDLYAAGVRSLTVTLPSLIELIRRKKYDFEIKASTVCQIINANKAMSYKRMGADVIVLDESINRDFDTLKRIRNAFGERIEIISNVICHKNCIYEMFHHNQTSHDRGHLKKPSVSYYSHRCMMKRCETIANIMRMVWIRPEDIKYYVDAGINIFKLQGRQAVLRGDPVRTTEYYLKESFDGNLIELLDVFSPTNSFVVYVDNKKLDDFIKPFVEKPGFCKNDCTSCGYCDAYVKKHLDTAKIKETFDMATDFYAKYDHYINLIEKTGNRPTNGENGVPPVKKLFETNTLDMEFEL